MNKLLLILAVLLVASPALASETTTIHTGIPLLDALLQLLGAAYAFLTVLGAVLPKGRAKDFATKLAADLRPGASSEAPKSPESAASERPTDPGPGESTK